jgi:hypothetical protein
MSSSLQHYTHHLLLKRTKNPDTLLLCLSFTLQYPLSILDSILHPIFLAVPSMKTVYDVCAIHTIWRDSEDGCSWDLPLIHSERIIVGCEINE